MQRGDDPLCRILPTPQNQAQGAASQRLLSPSHFPSLPAGGLFPPPLRSPSSRPRALLLRISLSSADNAVRSNPSLLPHLYGLAAICEQGGGQIPSQGEIEKPASLSASGLEMLSFAATRDRTSCASGPIHPALSRARRTLFLTPRQLDLRPIFPDDPVEDNRVLSEIAAQLPIFVPAVHEQRPVTVTRVVVLQPLEKH